MNVGHIVFQGLIFTIISMGWVLFGVSLSYFVVNWIDIGSMNWEAFWWMVGFAWSAMLPEYLFEFEG